MDSWRLKPATEKQKAFLRSWARLPSDGQLLRGEASDLINEIQTLRAMEQQDYYDIPFPHPYDY